MDRMSRLWCQYRVSIGDDKDRVDIGQEQYRVSVVWYGMVLWYGMVQYEYSMVWYSTSIVWYGIV